jgi:hypothetical protein
MEIDVKVITAPLRYRIPGMNAGKPFVPKIGEIISLQEEIAIQEISSGNVRRLLPEEIELMEQKKPKAKDKTGSSPIKEQDPVTEKKEQKEKPILKSTEEEVTSVKKKLAKKKPVKKKSLDEGSSRIKKKVSKKKVAKKSS